MDDLKSKLKPHQQLKVQVKCLEEQLRQSERARNIAEQDLSKLKELKCASASPFQESLQSLCPLLMHSKNVL